MEYTALPIPIETTNINTMLTIVHFHEPVSFLITATVATQGINNNVFEDMVKYKAYLKLMLQID